MIEVVLTSDQKETTIKGINNIQSAINLYSNQIEIMERSGINVKKAVLFKELAVDAIHLGIRKKSKVLPELMMGNHDQPNKNKPKQIIQNIYTNENN